MSQPRREAGFLERMKQAPKSSQVQFNVFLTRYRPGRDAVFVFVEGRDDPAFYGPMLRYSLAHVADLQFICCVSNKKGVLWALDVFRLRYEPDPNVLFMADRDFDGLLGRQPPLYPYLFMTKWYSIESYLAEWEGIRAYLVELAGLPSDESCLVDLQREYRRLLDAFCDCVRPLMEWMLGVRMDGLKAVFRNIKTKELFVWDSGSVRAALDPDDMVVEVRRVSGPNEPVPELAEGTAAAASAAVQGVDWRSWLRGKQLVWFVVSFVQYSRDFLTARGAKVRPRVALSESNALEVLSPRIGIPQDIREFLARVRSARVASTAS